MKKIVLTVLAALTFASSAFAHPLGFKEFGNRMIVGLDGDGVRLNYVIEIPTTILVGLIKNYMSANRLQSLSAEDEAKFNEQILQNIAAGLDVYLDGEKLFGKENPNFAGDKSGFGDFNFFEYRLHLIFPIDEVALGAHELKITNSNFKAWPSVFLNEVETTSLVKIVSSSADVCRSWNRDSFCRDTSIAFELLSYEAGAKLDGKNEDAGDKAKETNHLIKLLRQEKLDSSFVVISLLVAFLLGAAHAFSPGHGKALVASYLIGTRGAIKHSLFLGGVVTLSHISGVVIFGVLALVVSQYVLPEQYAPYIDIVSGVMILGIGVQIGRKRFLMMKSHAHHDHSHEHLHLKDDEVASWRSLLSMGLAAGIVPCPTAFVVMITAIAINRISYGLLLIAAFSLGLAVVLSVIGMAVVKMSGHLEKFDRFKRALPVVSFLSAVIVLLLGCAIIWKGVVMLAG